MSASSGLIAKPIAYWRLGTHFLLLAEGASGQLIKLRNPTSVVSDKVQSEESIVQATIWSDQHIGEPILFNFFHGIEVLLKGFIAEKCAVPKKHELTILLAVFESQYGHSSKFGSLIRDWLIVATNPTPWSKFLIENEILVDDWYLALKYPENEGKVFNHQALKSELAVAIPFWTALHVAAGTIRTAAVQFSIECGIRQSE